MILDRLRNNQSVILIADYGCGKTLLLVAAAQEISKQRKVLFICSLDSQVEGADNILDIAFKEQLGGNNNLEVASVCDMRRVLNKNRSTPVLQLIEEFVATKAAAEPELAVSTLYSGIILLIFVCG